MATHRQMIGRVHLGGTRLPYPLGRGYGNVPFDVHEARLVPNVVQQPFEAFSEVRVGRFQT